MALPRLFARSTSYSRLNSASTSGIAILFARIRFTLGIFVAIPLLGTSNFGLSQSATMTVMPVPPKPVMFSPSFIDHAIDPCVDFYHYACGGWLSNNPVPPDQTRWRRWNELAERNNFLLYRDLQAAALYPHTTLQQKYGAYFSACMDRAAADKIGIGALQLILHRVDEWTDKRELASLLGYLEYNEGQQLFFEFGPDEDMHDSKRYIASLKQAITAMPNKNDYIADDYRSRSVRQKYIAHIQRMFQLLGDSKDQSAMEAVDVLAVETELAKSEIPDAALFDPAKRDHRFSITQLQRLTPSFHWRQYLAYIHQSKLAFINVQNPYMIAELQKIIDSSTVEMLRSYMRWSIVHRYATFMNDSFQRETFAFFNEGQLSARPQWKQCTSATNNALGDAVAQDWISENFPFRSVKVIKNMVDSLRQALQQQIKSLDWMDRSTKKEALAKLDHLRTSVSHPDHWRDYSDLKISRENAVANEIAVDTFDRRYNLSKIGKAIDPDEWLVSPITVTAYTNFSMNQSVFPAGILQSPFFSVDADPSINFGAIGSIIGHEMTHGFDTVGHKYDAQGNVRNWWTPEDQAHFNADAECIRDEYSAFTIAPGIQEDGSRTLGENIADNGGLILAYKALMATLAQRGHSINNGTVDGFSPTQLFFLSFAQIHCQNQTDENIRSLAKVDPHSADEWRVNGTVRNMPAFAKAFGCKLGKPLAPVKTCHVW